MRVSKSAHGEMFDAFRLGLEKNDQGKEPDYDIVPKANGKKGIMLLVYCQKEENEDRIDTFLKKKNR
jgi:hypothetical protein